MSKILKAPKLLNSSRLFHVSFYANFLASLMHASSVNSLISVAWTFAAMPMRARVSASLDPA